MNLEFCDVSTGDYLNTVQANVRQVPRRAMKSGYLYVLVHPSDPTLVKVGITILKPEKRLAQHNSNYEKYAGQIVKKTGQKWELKTYMEVPEPYLAEAVFWGATPLADIPFRGGVEVVNLEWKYVQAGLDAVKKAGVRLSSEQLPNYPDWVYAYTRWMNKRLEGRGITLLGHVKSMCSGKASFQCSNGHEWRTRCAYVAEGEGCPQCGIGDRNPDEIWQAAKLGYLCLLIHPDKPGIIRIGLTYNKSDGNEENSWEGWEVHRYRFVEDPVAAETLIWKLLGHPLPHGREPIEIALSTAEQAFRDLIPEMHREIALAEKKKEGVQKTG